MDDCLLIAPTPTKLGCEGLSGQELISVDLYDKTISGHSTILLLLHLAKLVEQGGNVTVLLLFCCSPAD